MAAGVLVDQIRSFNRVVTQRVGALDDRYLGRNRPLGQDRVLWEIGTEGCEVRALRSRLGLDAGQGDELVAAMRTVRRLLTTSAIDIRPVATPGADARSCVRAYFAELDRRSDSGFDAAAGISAEPHEVTPPAGLFLVAYLHREPVGCGAVKHHRGEPSEIKRMWVAESARGLGIARRLLAELEADAVASGATTARLETNKALVEAIALYRSAGYVEVPAFNDEPFAHHWFEKRLPPPSRS